MSEAVLFTGANLIDGTGDAAGPDVTVVVEGERILAVGRGGTVPEPAAGRRDIPIGWTISDARCTWSTATRI